MFYKKASVFISTVIVAASLYSTEFTFDPDSIPNPRVNNGWITDVGDYISDEDELKINEIISEIESATSVEMAVVVVPNCGGDIFGAAQALGELWKVGKKDKDNGVIIVASIDEREFRTHTGYGVEEILPDGLVRTLQDAYVVPSFKRARYGEGILRYLAQLKKIFINDEESVSENSGLVEDVNQGSLKDEYLDNSNKIYKYNIKKHLLYWLIAFAGLISIIVGVIKYIKNLAKAAALGQKYQDYAAVKRLDEKGFVEIDTAGQTLTMFLGSFAIATVGAIMLGSSGQIFYMKVVNFIMLIVGIAFPITAVSIFNSRLGVIKKNIISDWRKRPKNCVKCSNSMTKLSESEDDAYLSKIQVAEERLNSLDYDVWICDSCKNTVIEKYIDKNFSRYIKCSGCGGITSKRTGSVVTRQPTYYSTGQREITYECQACSRKEKKYETIPKLEQTTSSSGGSYRSGGSSGGSYGGGSFGGGGATSKW
ncbi:MAG TPA: TPM domain-containing protein [Spirochaetota bacterium]|nr:TPM domain-containing protein [Spirochaetota bacterium]HOS54783.1 TPM domain-containing protein [Spirochaetota bacterium]HQF77415.1 TPM domain-containing protein [Spirochaetota bacterium]HQH30193.1 TPM domain-containing protein [Spirochaetota bacterium]HRU44945.1 TPM domain-containing protein [Spirochaetota bacterium]